MTKVKVVLCYDGKPEKEMILTLAGSPKGQRLMNAIEKEVEKQAADDKEWTRWNLIDVVTAHSA